MQYRVLVCDHIHSSATDLLRHVAEVEVTGPLSKEDLLTKIEGVDALLVRSQTKVPAEVFEAAQRLKIVARAGVGVDNIDISAATRAGVMVVNSPDGNTIAAAEHTVGLMLSLSRHIPDANTSLKAGEWRRKDFMGTELYHKTLGIMGLGKIGSHVAKVAQGLGMKLIAYDPFVKEEHAQRLGVEVLTLDEVLAASDYLSLHMPNTPETYHLINAERIAKMKKGIRIINCARGELIDTEALAQGLNTGHIAGAALDVFESEPLKDSPLQALGGNVVLTPHLGASTTEAQVNVAVDVAQEVAKVLQGQQTKNALNIPALSPSAMQVIKPYFNLAEKLGYFLGSLQTSAIEEVRITYHGELADKDTEPLKVAVLHGLLSPTLCERVNYVNALLLAQERGLQLFESRSSEARDYSNSIELEVRFTSETRSVAGAIIGDKQERIVNIDGHPISCIPTGNLLVIPHQDKPGMVGELGLLLGKHNINISGIQLGRSEKDGEAVMVVNIDNPPGEVLLAQLTEGSHFSQTRLVKF